MTDTQISSLLNGLAIALSPIIVLVLTGLMLRAV